MKSHLGFRLANRVALPLPPRILFVTLPLICSCHPTDTDPPSNEPTEMADNSYCYVCHLNYQQDELTMKHESRGIGCENCHGTSEQHSADEDGLIPPDVMFPKDKINSYCLTCHPEGSIDHISSHKSVLANSANAKAVCTDCHGQHRLGVRTRIWDRKTGRLISDDGVRMMYHVPATDENVSGL